MAEKNLRFKLARVEKDLSQEQLAKLVGISRQTVNMIEKGNYNPSIQLCLQLCWTLGKTLDELFWYEKPEHSREQEDAASEAPLGADSRAPFFQREVQP